MLPAEHTVPPVGVPSQKTSFVAYCTAYASTIEATNQVGNDYWWGNRGTEREDNKNKLATIVIIIRNLRKQI